MKIALLALTILFLPSCKIGTDTEKAKLKIMSFDCRGRKSLCKNINPSTIAKSIWPAGIGASSLGGGIATQNAIKKSMPKTPAKNIQKDFTKPQAKVTSSTNKRENDYIVFWDAEEFTQAFKNTCDNFKNGAETCLIELSRELAGNLDGEFITQRGIMRSGIEVKRFESDSSDLCSINTQEVELKSGCAIPLLAAAGSILGAVNIFMDVGVRVTTKTNLSEKLVTDSVSPMFECGAKCDLPFLRAELAMTEEGIKFERHITINSLNVPKDIRIQRRQENTMSWDDIAKWVNDHKDDAPSKFKSYMNDYMEKKRKFWNETDPELTKWPEIMCNVNP